MKTNVFNKDAYEAAKDLKKYTAVLNGIILAMCCKYLPKGFTIQSLAPNTFKSLLNDFKMNNYITVSSEHSGKTIYASNLINYHLRAWHDYVHLTNELDFAFENEIKVANIQIEQILEMFGDSTPIRRACCILFADTTGQQQYYNKYNSFPENQAAFVASYLLNDNQVTREF